MVDAYDGLAGVYEWLVPEPLLAPEGSVAAFADVVDTLDEGARVLDCACGIGQLAVGLAVRGFEVVASDASAGMVKRTRELAERHGVAVDATRCTWAELPRQGWQEPFDAVFCVGNSLVHAVGKDHRLAALRAMAGTLRQGGLLVLTSRNWEQVRQQGSRLQVADQLVQRGSERALVVHAWTIPQHWEDEHSLEIAVARLSDDGSVTTQSERLSFWPFRHGELDDELRAVGLTPEHSTYAGDLERYLVTARALITRS